MQKLPPGKHLRSSRPCPIEQVPVGLLRSKTVSEDFFLRALAARDGSCVGCPPLCLFRGATTRGRSRKAIPMAQHCQFCGKTPVTGRRISHAHNVTSRKWHINLKSVHAVV